MPSPNDMMAAVAASMKKRTGRDLAEWVALVEAAGIDSLDQNAVRRWLGTEHGVPQNSRWAIADAAARAAGWEPPRFDEYVAGQYAGARANLRPIYDRLAAELLALGGDVRAEGRSTYVPFIRARQFAAVQAATRDRVDLGLRFTTAPASARLLPAKAPGQATHKVELRGVDEVDAELLALLRAAYEQNG